MYGIAVEVLYIRTLGCAVLLVCTKLAVLSNLTSSFPTGLDYILAMGTMSFRLSLFRSASCPYIIVVEPCSVRTLAADYRIQDIFKHIAFALISSLRCSCPGSNGVPAI